MLFGNEENIYRQHYSPLPTISTCRWGRQWTYMVLGQKGGNAGLCSPPPPPHEHFLGWGWGVGSLPPVPAARNKGRSRTTNRTLCIVGISLPDKDHSSTSFIYLYKLVYSIFNYVRIVYIDLLRMASLNSPRAIRSAVASLLIQKPTHDRTVSRQQGT